MTTIKQALENIMTLDGILCAAIVDSSSGMVLGSLGSGIDLEIAAAGNTELVRTKLKTMKALGTKDHIEDILITLGKQYHIICPLKQSVGIFIYTVVEVSKGNLALARRKIHDTEADLVI
ncbi:hypothetical protein AwPolaro_04090 [Polaromonas sp.]|nr:hypothetical protein AwPolaro_04090 [Polaromonas sp.]